MSNRTRYYTVNLDNDTLTDEVIVDKINIDGTVDTDNINRLMLLNTLLSISFKTQKEAEIQAVKNFLSAPLLFTDEQMHTRISDFMKTITQSY